MQAATSPGACWAAVAVLLAVLLGGCASPRPAPAPAAGSAPDPAPRLGWQQANDVTVQAISLVGTPYRFGGNTPDAGFDCSGLITYVYRTSAGVLAPRTVASLATWGQVVPAAAVRSGDLVVFSPNGVGSHAGIYVGEGRFVHAPSSGGEVRLDSLRSSYWARQPVSYRRP